MRSDTSLALLITAPVASFRKPYAREYLETYTCVPPSTVFGALLSAVGEVNRMRHTGARLAIAMIGRPARSVVLRTTWRIKDRRVAPGTGSNLKPDYQELLTGIRVAAWITAGPDEQEPSLAARLSDALRSPGGVERFGGLALGESTHLVDELRPLRIEDGKEADFVVPDQSGPLVLPLWPDHVGSAATRWLQARMERRGLGASAPKDCWVELCPPVGK